MPFKDADKMPQIQYIDHLKTMAKHISRDLDTLADGPTVCLICHKDESARRLTVSPDHLADMLKVMRGSSQALLDNPKVCLMCHCDSIHDSVLLGKLRERER
jgi:hypothetical protein